MMLQCFVVRFSKAFSLCFYQTVPSTWLEEVGYFTSFAGSSSIFYTKVLGGNLKITKIKPLLRSSCGVFHSNLDCGSPDITKAASGCQ